MYRESHTYTLVPPCERRVSPPDNSDSLTVPKPYVMRGVIVRPLTIRSGQRFIADWCNSSTTGFEPVGVGA